jgi:putative ABC transport system permease protein
MKGLIQDLRYSLRLLMKRPGFTLVAVITLALGIGANSAIFSVVNAVLLRPLPYPNAEQLIMIWGKLPAHGLEQLNASPPEFVDYRDRNQAFAAVAAYASLGRNLTGAGEPERINVTFVTAGFFAALATPPWRGRVFFDAEDQPGHDQVAVLSYGLWQRQFAGDDQIIGRSIMLDGKSHTIVGVMPASFQFPDTETQLWKPMAFAADDLSDDSRGSHYLSLIARTQPGVTREQAQADVNAIAAEMQQEHPSYYEAGSGWGASVVSLREQLVGDVRTALLVLLCAVGFVLLIACANVANLLLARAATRQREIAIRAALGAGRWHIIRQLLAESLLLAVTGGALGLLLALWGKDLLLSLNPASLPFVNEVRVDAKVMAFTFAVSLLTALVFGIAPALQASKLNLSESLKESGSKATDSKSRHRLRGWLVASEVALAMVLLVGAGLMIKSLYRLKQVDPGFDPTNVLTLRLSLPQAKYITLQQQRAFFDQLVERMAALPDVNSVGVVNFLPFSGSGNRRNISVEGKPENPINVEFRISNPDYFRAMGIQLRKGRLFDEHDRDNSTYVAVVNETFTRIFLPDEEPLGKRIKMGGLNSPFRWLTIAGVVKDLKHRGLDAETRPEMYIPYLQPPLADWNIQSLFLVVRTENDPQRLLLSVPSIVQGIDREQPVYAVSTMQQLLNQSVATRRFNMLLMAIFAALALLLAAVGIYGVMSQAVSGRTREIGIRMALGAQATDVLRLIVGQGLKLTIIGVMAGLATALALTRLIESLLFGVSATDPLTFAAVALLLTAVALLACYIPARRATKVDPMIALRYE